MGRGRRGRAPRSSPASVGLALVANVGKVLAAGRHPSVATALLQTGGSGLGATAMYQVVRTRWTRAS